MNESLGNVGQTIEYCESTVGQSEICLDSIRELATAMQAGELQSLIILGGNPVYDTPADLQFRAALAKVPLTVHLGQYDNETSSRCTWHIPQAHPLESWGDTRGIDGTASIIQPLIAPLYRGITAAELVNSIGGNPPATSYDLVQNHWRTHHADAGRSDEFQSYWETAVHDGVVAETTSASRQVSVRQDLASVIGPGLSTAAKPIQREEITLAFCPDASVWDGRFANNGWLQELPRPLTKITWDNPALIAPTTANRLGLRSGDEVEIAVAGSAIELPVFVLPGQPRDVVALSLGYGRQRSGRVGNGVGTDVYPLRSSAGMWYQSGATVRKTGRTRLLAATQHHHLMEGRHLIRAGTLEELRANPQRPGFMAVGHEPAADASLYPTYAYEGNKWGMVVNLSACIGCEACVIACQAENNIPVVGRDQVARGREMHWLRIDHYYEGDPDDPMSFHQPVMCQHCELAPCEPVCPVGATTHSSEGLNEMTYNRCVGTRVLFK